MPKTRTLSFACAGLIALALSSPPPAAASWPLDTLANVPLCSLASNQVVPAAVPDGAGGAIVAWTDTRSGATDVYAQRISIDGNVLWATDGVAVCDTSFRQQYPVAVPDGAGGAIFVWLDTRGGGVYDLYAQRLSAAGAPQWTRNGVAVCVNGSDKFTPALATDGAGGAIIAWREARLYDDDIYAQRISAAGTVQWTTNGVVVCSATRAQLNPRVVPDTSGGAIVAWQDSRASFTDYNIYAQRLAAATGASRWTANGVALCTATGNQDTPTLVADGAGGAVVAWEDFRAGEWDTYAQRISTSGAVQWTADGVALCIATGHQMLPVLATDGAGGAIATWQDARAGYLLYDVYAQRISAGGTVQWTPDGVPLSAATNAQAFPAIEADGAGGAIVTWQDFRGGASNDVYAQRVSGSGAIAWAADGVLLSAAPGDQSTPVLVPDGLGGAIVAWEDYRAGNPDVYGQRVWADGTTPVLLSFVRAEEAADGITLTWLADRTSGAVATVYRCTVPGEWTAVGRAVADGRGYLRFTDRTAPDVARVGYRLGVLEAGAESFLGETWIERAALELALHGAQPNPARGGELTVRFTLGTAGAASLELLDVAGRRVATRDVGSLGAGRHSLRLVADRRIAPGLYLLCLRQGANARVTRVAVLD